MKPCKLLFLAQSILIIIIVSTYVIALGDEEGRREYTAISQCILISSVCVRVCVCEELHSGWQCGNSGAQSSLCF